MSDQDEGDYGACVYCNNDALMCHTTHSQPLCAECADHLCVRCGDALQVPVDHSYADWEMCQECLDDVFMQEEEGE